MTHKHGIACGAHNHAENGQPNVCHAHWWIHAIPDAQHVAHCLKQSIRVLLTPSIILQRNKTGSRRTESGRQRKESESKEGVGDENTQMRMKTQKEL